MYYPHYFPDRATMLKTAATQEESLLKQLENFAADFGADKLENFRERMDRLFGPARMGRRLRGRQPPPIFNQTFNQMFNQMSRSSPNLRLSPKPRLPARVSPNLRLTPLRPT
jgi:hypothetical protein